MYFLLAWFHAIIQERLRYAPLGWSKKYEFGESDLRSACDTVDTWLDDTAKASVGCAWAEVEGKPSETRWWRIVCARLTRSRSGRCRRREREGGREPAVESGRPGAPAPHTLTSLPLQGRQNISPDKIPWSALKTLMAQSIYGGRVDNEFDQRLLNTFLERLFTTKSFDSEFKLACKVDGHKDIQMPDGIRYTPASRDRHGRGTRPFPASHVTTFPDVLVLQARGVRAVGGAAPRRSDALLAGPAQQR